MKQIIANVSVLTAVVISIPALACSRPDAPKLPDAQSAVIAEMVKAKSEVKNYLDDAEKYLNCVRIKKRQEQIMEEMRIVTSDFNFVVQVYKERMKTQQVLAKQ